MVRRRYAANLLLRPAREFTARFGGLIGEVPSKKIGKKIPKTFRICVSWPSRVLKIQFTPFLFHC